MYLEILKTARDRAYHCTWRDRGASELVKNTTITLHLPKFRYGIAEAAPSKAMNP